jgi:hypothetical protein
MPESKQNHRFLIVLSQSGPQSKKKGVKLFKIPPEKELSLLSLHFRGTVL